jgi:uncharacterized alkaline shock family protein YloU
VEVSAPLGTIRISNAVVAQIVGRAAAESYGVVGMAGRKLLPGDRPGHGVSVRDGDGGLRIDVHVVVEYGLNLAEVGATVRSRVVYEVERLTGLRIGAVEVHIRDVRRSA